MSTNESSAAFSSQRSKQRVSFASVDINNLGTVRKLNAVLFPIRYSEKFYKDVLLPEAEEFCKLIYLNDVPVGTICCRLENKDGQAKLYLMTMGVLAPYRSRKIGSESLEHVLAAASAQTKPQITLISLHVQTSNADAKRFYERHGFVERGVQEDYYKKIEPRGAWILEREIKPSVVSADALGTP